MNPATCSLEPTNDLLALSTKLLARTLIGLVMHQVSESRSLLNQYKPLSPL